MLADLAQAEAGQEIGIVRRLLEEAVVDAVGFFELTEIGQRLGQVELGAGIVRVELDEVLERGAGFFGIAGAEVEIALLPLEIDVRGVLADERREQIRGLPPFAVLLIDVYKLEHGGGEGGVAQDGLFQILAGLGVAVQGHQHQRIVVVEGALVGGPLDESSQALLGLRRSLWVDEDLGHGRAADPIVGIELVGGLKVREGLFDLASVAAGPVEDHPAATEARSKDRKSTRLNSSHQIISYAVFCLKKKKNAIDPSDR